MEAKKVLIALDYNPTAQTIAEAGHSLARSLGAHTILLHVVSDPLYYSTPEYSPIMGFSGYMDMGPVQAGTIEWLLNASLQFLEKSKQHLVDNEIQTVVRDGDYADKILEVAIEMSADIIVIGSHSRKWLDNIVMGSVTEKVLHHTTIPLFIIPTKKQL